MNSGASMTVFALLIIAPLLSGGNAQALTDSKPGPAKARTDWQSYESPRGEPRLRQCVEEIRAKYPGHYQYPRYLEQSGVRTFVFHVFDPAQNEDRQIQCDADIGVLLP